MKNSCDVIQDLLPLYCDGACSGESRHLVEEHLRECGQCRETYELMRSALPARAVPAEDGQAAQAAAAAWKKGTHRAARRAYFIALAVIVAVIAAVCLRHGLHSTAEGSILGMTAQAEKLLNTENSELVLAKKRGDYLAVMVRTESGGCGMDILERDGLFHDRWRGGPGSAGIPAGFLHAGVFGGGSEDEMPVLVVFGLDLPEAACWYTFEYDSTTYTRPIVSHRALDVFFPMSVEAASYTITVTLLDENMNELT